jgi:alpha-glucosidase
VTRRLLSARHVPGALALVLVFSAARTEGATYTVKSPGGNLTLTVSHDGEGLSYSVTSARTPVVTKGALGMTTSRGDFTKGLRFVRQAPGVVNETYTLPTGKRSTYVSHANELTLAFTKGGQEMGVALRAYDEGFAFRYLLPGTGDVEISAETSTIPLASRSVRFWGQAHPNDYGYETPLGLVTAERISMPVLAELEDSKHFVFVAQAGSYGTYVIPHFERRGSVLSVRFPLDQKEPVQTSLPFQSPWRFVIVAPGTLARIVESSLVEHLNPPTEKELQDASWIRPGRASWDFLAKDGDKLGTWVDFDAEMGWEWHVADAGWERRVPHMAETTAYAKARNVAIMAWGKVANRTALNSPERIEAWMANLEKLGIRGAKVDFFDQQDDTAAKTDDLEDTQNRLKVRDWLSEAAARHKLMVEFHGCAVPSGERRRWPHVMSAEAVYGMERREQKVGHDLTLPYVRNVIGPMSFTPLHLTRSAGSLGYQLGQSVIYEAGIQIYSERHDRILAFAGVALLKALPATWDDIEFLEGLPGSHAILARRKGEEWFVGGMTDAARTASVPLGFLKPGVTYEAEIYRDGEAKGALVKETKTVTSKDVLSLPMLQAGGFAVRVRLPAPPAPAAPGR